MPDFNVIPQNAYALLATVRIMNWSLSYILALENISESTTFKYLVADWLPHVMAHALGHDEHRWYEAVVQEEEGEEEQEEVGSEQHKAVSNISPWVLEEVQSIFALLLV